jgi:quercetin dioxygenase-like cupin family protein
MIITPAARHAGIGGKRGSQFTGEAHPYLVMPTSDGVTINTVAFNPGARTFWHSHERGQILQVLAGCGLIQSEGAPVRALVAGDTVWVPPGERHWHGAAPDSYMVHTAISLGVTAWDDPVADGDYATPPTPEEQP